MLEGMFSYFIFIVVGSTIGGVIGYFVGKLLVYLEHQIKMLLLELKSLDAKEVQQVEVIYMSNR